MSTPPAEAGRYMTTDEVAALLRTPPETLRFWRHRGKGPKSWKPGARVLYDRADVEQWITDERAKPDGDGPRAA